MKKILGCFICLLVCGCSASIQWQFGESTQAAPHKGCKSKALKPIPPGRNPHRLFDVEE